MDAASSWKRLLPVLVIALVAIAGPLLLRPPAAERTVVVYCAHDSIFADSILHRFEQETGIHVDVRYDEESSKSLGLTNLLLTEKDQPRCDVFWNNQAHGTIRLALAGVLATCDEGLFARIPDRFKDPESRWCGFAGRLRVHILNTDRIKADAETIVDRMNATDLSRVAIAVPLFGTTLTHYSVLCDEMGLEGLKRWHESLHQRGIREVRGNGAVRDLVAEGACDFGFTDTDDAFAARDAGKPVELLPVRTPNGYTICIPNTVAMIQGARHPEEAGRLIAWLLSKETELAMAHSASRQIPLGPVDESEVPPDVKRLMKWAGESVLVTQGADADAEVLTWLSALYTGQ